MTNKKTNFAFKELCTEAIQLKAINYSHAEDIFKIYSDYEVMRFTDSTIHSCIEDSIRYIKRLQYKQRKREIICWGIFLKNSNKLIGTVAIHTINRKHFFASLSIILDKNYWNRGISTEALGLVVKYAFEELKLNRLEAQVFVEQKASSRVFEKLGFQREARLRQNFLIEGKFEDSFLYSILSPIKL
ncbi:MAG: GNAT family N-acetyltransferase [Bacteroidia bacterium]|nr:GNAT family N-acetyltransferase [Bacteroidia bacterium]